MIYLFVRAAYLIELVSLHTLFLITYGKSGSCTVAVKFCRDGLLNCLHLSYKIKTLFNFFLFYRTCILQIYGGNQDTTKVQVPNRYLRPLEVYLDGSTGYPRRAAWN